MRVHTDLARAVACHGMGGLIHMTYAVSCIPLLLVVRFIPNCSSLNPLTGSKHHCPRDNPIKIQKFHSVVYFCSLLSHVIVELRTPAMPLGLCIVVCALLLLNVRKHFSCSFDYVKFGCEGCLR